MVLDINQSSTIHLPSTKHKPEHNHLINQLTNQLTNHLTNHLTNQLTHQHLRSAALVQLSVKFSSPLAAAAASALHWQMRMGECGECACHFVRLIVC